MANLMKSKQTSTTGIKVKWTSRKWCFLHYRRASVWLNSQHDIDVLQLSMYADIDSVHCATPALKFDELFLNLSHWAGTRYGKVPEPRGSVPWPSTACSMGTPRLHQPNRWLTELLYACTHKYMQGKSELKTDKKHKTKLELKSPVCTLYPGRQQLTTFDLINQFVFLQYKPLLHVRQRIICWLQLSYSEIPPSAAWRRKRRGFFSQKAWWDYKQMWLRHNPIQARTLDCLPLISVVFYESEPLRHEIIEKVLRSQRGLLELNLLLGCLNDYKPCSRYK